MSKKKWMCATIEDGGGDITVGTNGTLLRIRRAGLAPVEIELKDCQQGTTLNRGKFEIDPLFHKADELEAFMKERRQADMEAAEHRKKFGLKQSIKKALT